MLGGFTDLGTIEAATAGWAASLLAGIAGFFHVTSSRDADRRLAAAGAGTVRVVAARVTSALALAAVAGLARWWRSTSAPGSQTRPASWE